MDRGDTKRDAFSSLCTSSGQPSEERKGDLIRLCWRPFLGEERDFKREGEKGKGSGWGTGLLMTHDLMTSQILLLCYHTVVFRASRLRACGGCVVLLLGRYLL
jgi:hypothetical protein